MIKTAKSARLRRGCCTFLYYNLCCETPALRVMSKPKGGGVFGRMHDVTLMRTKCGKVSLIADRQGFVQALLVKKSRGRKK